MMTVEGSRTKNVNGTPLTFSYDNSNQLTDDDVNSYSYDGSGNRTGGSYSTGTGNQITNDGVYRYTYDVEGNLTKKSKGSADETWIYEYDHRNQLTSVQKWAEDPVGMGPFSELLEVDYEYDVFGNRIERDLDFIDDVDSENDSTERYSYDGWKPGGGFVGNENWDVWADFDGSNTFQQRYVRGDQIDQLLGRIDSSDTVAWYLTDHVGSVRHMIDNSGVVQNTIVYDGFGNITSESNASFEDRYKWTGREWDTEAKLQYNRARFYDPAIGRWTSQDPLGFAAGDSNLYRYVNNRPVMATDPSGLQQVWERTGRQRNIDGREVVRYQADGSPRKNGILVDIQYDAPRQAEGAMGF